jgi:hypothetical protein
MWGGEPGSVINGDVERTVLDNKGDVERMRQDHKLEHGDNWAGP